MLCHTIEKFYHIICFVQTVGVSAATGDGLTEFFSAVDAAASEYERLLIYTVNIPRLWYKQFCKNC